MVKVKFSNVILLILFFSSFSVHSFTSFDSKFTEKQALIMLFGNYDPFNRKSIWRNMRFPTNNNIDSLFSENKNGIVKIIFFKPYKEDRKEKIFLLEKTIPSDSPFECHACLPMLGAAVFVNEKGNWKIESQNLFLMFAGEYGESPFAKLILIGKDKFGVSLEYDHKDDECTNREMTLLVPYKKSIEKLFQETIFYNNFNDCGRSIPCAAFSAKIDFVNSDNDTFWNLKVKKSGTEVSRKQINRVVSINEESIYQFFDGKYVRKFRNREKPNPTS